MLENARTRRRYLDATEVSCPACRAAIGQPCLDARGRNMAHGSHAERQDLQRDLLLRGGSNVRERRKQAPLDLPKDLRGLTAEQTEEVLQWLVGLPLHELRRRQGLVEQQLRSAARYGGGNERSVVNLQIMERHLQSAVGEKEWRDHEEDLGDPVSSPGHEPNGAPTLGQVERAAKRAKAPYVLGSKVLIDRVASELGIPVKELAPHLMRWQDAGLVRLSRIDLVAAFDGVKGSLRRSWVPHPGTSETQRLHGWDAIDRDSFGGWRQGAVPYVPNDSHYYVWVLRRGSDVPLDEGPYGPYALPNAKDYARIGATEGEHDRAVSRGVDPKTASFEIVRRYAARTGERII